MMMHKKAITFCLKILLFAIYFTVDSMNGDKILDHEQKLIDKLFKNYNNKLMPSGTIEIKIAFNIIQLIQIIERDQIMLINAFVDHKWTDQRLKWSIFFTYSKVL
jgi:hypothetical protein